MDGLSLGASGAIMGITGCSLGHLGCTWPHAEPWLRNQQLAGILVSLLLLVIIGACLPTK